MPIRKYNLDPSLIQWIMTQTGLGPGIGELFWVAPAASATSQFRTQLQRWGVEQDYKIYDSVITAQAAMVAGRNDVMLIMPGTYTGTGATPLAWDLDYTHMVGLCHPHSRGIVIRTISTSGINAMHNTGDICQFHNVSFQNWGQNAACLSAVKEGGHHNLYKGVDMMGDIRAEQVAVQRSCSLHIDSSVAGNGEEDIFDDCIIGDCGGEKRTFAQNGVIHIGPTGSVGAGKNMEFRNCQILSRSQTAACVAVTLPAAWTIDRILLFKGTIFYNFYDGAETLLTEVFYDNSSNMHKIVLDNNCTQAGWTNWGSTGSFSPWHSMASVGAGGGIAAEGT